MSIINHLKINPPYAGETESRTSVSHKNTHFTSREAIAWVLVAALVLMLLVSITMQAVFLCKKCVWQKDVHFTGLVHGLDPKLESNPCYEVTPVIHDATVTSGRQEESPIYDVVEEV